MHAADNVQGVGTCIGFSAEYILPYCEQYIYVTQRRKEKEKLPNQYTIYPINRCQKFNYSILAFRCIFVKYPKQTAKTVNIATPDPAYQNGLAICAACCELRNETNALPRRLR
jgi:hypothetical protein